MLALTGNTGPYLQYAAARIRSVLRKADPSAAAGPITIGDPAERALCLAVLGFGAVVSQVGQLLEPHRLCTYLFNLAQTFTTFYETCPVLGAPSPGQRASRLALCDATVRVLGQGMDLLGIAAPEQM